jgi:ribonuclease HII
MKQNHLLSNFSTHNYEAGCDEAGRGCFAGPVFAAAVIFPKEFSHPQLNDSKALSEKQRYALRPVIQENALAWAVAFIDVNLIDSINILNASILAMHTSLEQLTIKPDFIIVDGNRFNSFQNIPYTTIIKGDSKYLSIAAASILAKTFRDDYMNLLHQSYPAYNWEKNKGYGTLQHRQMIVKLGLTPHHRRSFKLIDTQLELPFCD